MSSSARAVLIGSVKRPELRVYFDPSEPHATAADKTLLEWVKWLPAAFWRQRGGYWLVTATGRAADHKFRQAGIAVDLESETLGTDLEGVLCLDELVDPISRLAANGASALILPRLSGFDRTKELLGDGARWDRDYKRFVIPVADAMHRGAPRPGIQWDPPIIQAAIESLGRVTTRSDIAQIVAEAGVAKSLAELDKDAVAKLKSVIGGVPDWFGLNLFEFQEAGAIAVAAGHNVLADEPGLGKAQPLSEPVLTPGGWRAMGELAVGDQVIGSNGRACTVEGVFDQGVMDIARVTFTDGSWTRATWDHLWQVATPSGRSWASGGRQFTDGAYTTRQLLDAGLSFSGTQRWEIPLVAAVTYPPVELPLDPYVVGLLVGDSFAPRHDTFVTVDDAVAGALTLPVGAAITPVRELDSGTSEYRVDGIESICETLGLIGVTADTKRLPEAYVRASYEDRLALLQGILDVDGALLIADRKHLGCFVSWRTVSPDLARQVTDLVQSLGGLAQMDTRTPGRTRLLISLPSGVPPFQMVRKRVAWSRRKETKLHRKIVSIEPDGAEAARCIRVSAADHLYVTRSFIVTHNTRQAIAAAAILGAERTVITCLPVGLTGWKNEVLESNLHTLGGKNPDGRAIVIRSGKKPEPFPDKGVIITSDSLLSARPELLKELIQWQPDVFAYDEAHRGKTYESARSKATRALSQATRLMPIPMSGTPLFASPHELAPILEFSGHLSPIFGGLGAFLERYCKKDKFGGFYARKENLPELRMKLQNDVWVRRRKRDVLPDLPKASLFARYVDVKLTDYHKAYKDVMAVIGLWVDAVVENTGATPDDETIKDWAMSQVGLVSMLRKAAGVAKVPAAVEIIQDHVNDTTEIVAGKKTFTRPLVVWTHHQDVTAAMAAAVPAAVGESGIIAGGTSPAERDRLVSEFQAGNIPVLVCSISAAGVAITLTRSQDSIFVESDWTPAAIRQAIDRQERIGQQNAITATTLLAEGTLDLRIQKVLKEKSAILDVLYGDGNDVSVISADDDVTSASQIVIELVQQVLDTRR